MGLRLAFENGPHITRIYAIVCVYIRVTLGLGNTFGSWVYIVMHCDMHLIALAVYALCFSAFKPQNGADFEAKFRGTTKCMM